MVGFTKRIKGRKIFYYYIEGILDFEVFVNNVAFVQYVRSFGNF
jgi:hypothetical protein